MPICDQSLDNFLSGYLIILILFQGSVTTNYFDQELIHFLNRFLVTIYHTHEISRSITVTKTHTENFSSLIRTNSVSASFIRYQVEILISKDIQLYSQCLQREYCVNNFLNNSSKYRQYISKIIFEFMSVHFFRV